MHDTETESHNIHYYPADLVYEFSMKLTKDRSHHDDVNLMWLNGCLNNVPPSFSSK